VEATFLWAMRPFIAVEIHRCFRETYHRGRRLSQTSDQQEGSSKECLYLAGHSFGSHFDAEDRGTRFFRNVGELSLGYKETFARRKYGTLHDIYNKIYSSPQHILFYYIRVLHMFYVIILQSVDPF
jgi:hypothetical protein